MDGQTDGRTDDAKTISLRLCRGIKMEHLLFQITLLYTGLSLKGTLAKCEDPDERPSLFARMEVIFRDSTSGSSMFARISIILRD